MDLLELCATLDPSFKDELEDADNLTDYAVEIRYPDVWLDPGIEDAKEAFEMAKKVKELVLTQFFFKNTIKSVSCLSLDPGHMPAVFEHDKSKAL